MNTFIYILWDPRNNNKCYIGKSNNPDNRFRNGHVQKSCLKFKTIKNDWIKKLKKLGLTPTLEILDEVPLSEWGFWERHYISLYKSWGFNLTNDPKCPGGESGPTTQGPLTLAHKSKISRKLKLFYKLNPKIKKIKVKSNTKRIVSQETRLKLSIAKSNYMQQRDKKISLEIIEKARQTVLAKRVDWCCPICCKSFKLRLCEAKVKKSCSHKCSEQMKRKINI